MAKVEIFTAQRCSYCSWTKQFFERKGIEYDEFQVDTDTAKREEMLARAKMTSVPQIFIGGMHIGGYEDLVELDQDGKLNDMLGGP